MPICGRSPGLLGESAPEDSAPVLVERINEVYRQYFGPVTDYDEIKRIQ